MLARLRSTYFYICWLPVAVYLLSDVYISTSSGWGQWAMGVVVLPPMLLDKLYIALQFQGQGIGFDGPRVE
ncbi:MAG: hypothetical protein ACI82A_000595 [Candidatus Azotimanducaceae bacterium]|jgi:hypothetical protein